MEACHEIIDLCEVKTVKSEATSDTVPLDETKLATTKPLTKEEDEAKRCFTEQWIYGQSITSNDQQTKTECFDHGLVPSVVEYSNTVDVTMNTPDILKTNNSFDLVLNTTSIVRAASAFDLTVANERNGSMVIPPEITDLVNKDCVIKLVNHLVIYTISRHNELELFRKILAITPDIDPQINYRCKIGFQCVYERCLVLFYEALLDLTEILLQFTIPMQNIVILWLYNMVDNMCKPLSVDCSFLRNENYIEKLFLDFTKCQKQIPVSDNMFYNVYQKLIPAPVTTANVSEPAPKKPRKPRAKKE